MKTKYGELVKGDLIGVAYNNYIYLAIFEGEGFKGNAQLYPFWSVMNHRNYKRTGRLRKSHICRKDINSASPIVKINPADLVNENDQLDYLEVTQYLKQMGI